MAENEVRRIAVLIDADNTSLGCLEEVLTELSLRGRIIVKRAYGNWKKEELKNWPEEINKLAIRAVQQFDYVAGKNATDIALVIDALDLLYTGNYDAFALVSSDSDYTPLAIRLHESGAYVYGFGKSNTSRSFVNACDEFIILENLLRTSHRNRSQRVNRQSRPANAGRAAAEASSAGGAKASPENPSANAAKAAPGNPAEEPSGNVKESSTENPAKAAGRGAENSAADGGKPDAGAAGRGAENNAADGGKTDAGEAGHRAERRGELPRTEGAETAEEIHPEVSEEDLAEIHGLLRKIWEENQNEEGFVYNSLAGILLRRIKPDFDPRTYGEKRLTDLLYRYPEHYEIVAADNGHKGYCCVD